MSRPARLHLVQAFPGDYTHTTAEFAAELGDVASSTLSRHAPLRTRARVVQVVPEWGVRAGSRRADMLRADAAGMIEDVERHLDAARATRSRTISATELLRGG